MGFIYKITNMVTNKNYIGKTKKTISARFKEHKKAAKDNKKNYHLYNSMNKYGLDCFFIELIEECSDNKLNERESYWIDYYNTYYNGYNETFGGDGRTKYDYKLLADTYLETKSEKNTAEMFGCSKSVVQHACETYSIKINKGLSPEYWKSEKGQKHKEQIRQLGLASKGRIVSKETRKKQSEARKEKYAGKNSPMYGKKFSQEHRERMSQNSAWAKKVKCIETGEVYSSALQASKAVKLKSSSGISKCCNGERKTAGGFHWTYVKEGENN